MRKTRYLACCVAAVLLMSATVAHAEYCLNYSSGVKSLARQSGSSSSRGCVATEQECKAALISNASSYSGSCYYVPGLYPPTQGAASSGTSSSIDQAARANDSAQKKIRAQQQAEEQAAQRAAQEASQGLLQAIKIPTVDKARAQLDCVQRASSSSKREEAARRRPDATVRGGADDFENAEDCRPVSSNVPEVSAPVPVAEALPLDPAQQARLLDSLQVRQRDARQRLDSQDRDIAKLEAKVKREEQAPKADIKTAPVESDALRRAREALAKARADRQKTEAEYDKLQQQAQATRERQANTP